MPRAHEWRRIITESVASASDYSSVICTLAPGETVLRVRGQANLSTFYSSPDITRGLPVAWGIYLDDAGTGPTLDPVDATDVLSQRWMWWEGISLTDSPQFDLSSPQYLAYGPAGDPVRDIKAERKANASIGSYLWVRGNVDPALSVGYFAWQWSWSALILEAP